LVNLAIRVSPFPCFPFTFDMPQTTPPPQRFEVV